MYSALAWIPRGAAKNPEKSEAPTADELRRMRAKAQAAADGSRQDAEGSDEDDEWEEMDGEEEMDEGEAERKGALAAAAAVGRAVDDLAELNMDAYDDEPDSAFDLFTDNGMAYRDQKEDPYLLAGADVDSDEEVDDTLLATDILMMTARTEDDVSHLEVWVYEEGNVTEAGNMYVHHDLMLSSFPLSVAWLDCVPGEGAGAPGNLVAIATFNPEIEIWDLDALDVVEPAGLLGGYEAGGQAAAAGADGKKKKKKKSAKPALREGSHADAVLCLSWNSGFRNVLASASADNTVKVWDLASQKCEHTLTHHTDKVQSVAWNPAEAAVMLTGGFDKAAHLLDVRKPTSTVSVALTADTECVAWDLGTPQRFLVATEDGLVACHDARKLGQSGDASHSTVYTLSAHDKATCAMSFNPAAPQVLATASTDKTVKLWDTTGGSPSCLATENPKVGAVFSMGFCKDSPFLLAAAGSKGEVCVWDTLTNTAVARAYGHLAGRAPTVGNGMVLGHDGDRNDAAD